MHSLVYKFQISKTTYSANYFCIRVSFLYSFCSGNSKFTKFCGVNAMFPAPFTIRFVPYFKQINLTVISCNHCLYIISPRIFLFIRKNRRYTDSTKNFCGIFTVQFISVAQAHPWFKASCNKIVYDFV